MKFIGNNKPQIIKGWEDWKREVIQRYPEYDFSEVEYVNRDTKVKISCRIDGNSWMAVPRKMLKDRSENTCKVCKKRDYINPQLETVESFSNKINYKYPEHSINLSNLKSIAGQHSEIKLECTIHGEFITTPNRALNNTNPCPKCSKEITGRSSVGDIDNFIKRATLKYGDKYSYDKVEFTRLADDISVFCNTHQEYFKINANNFIYNAKIGCPKCIREYVTPLVRKSQEDFIRNCEEVHRNTYDLSEVQYTTSKSPIKVICKIHGAWYPPASNFEKGSGCPYCANLNKIRYTKYPTLFYVFKINDIYKIGITYKDFEKRYARELSKEDLNSIEILFSYKFSTGRPAFLLEQKIRSIMNKHQYKGVSPFKCTGNSELFVENPINNDFYEIFKKLKEEDLSGKFELEETK